MEQVFRNAKKKCDKSKDPAIQAIPALLCHEWYPVKSDTTVLKEYVKGDPVEIPGEVRFVMYDCDSAAKAEANKKYAPGTQKSIRIPVPVYQRVDTQKILQNIVSKDSAELHSKNIVIEDLQRKSLNATDALISKDKKIDSLRLQRNWTWGILAALIASFIAFKLIKR